MEPSFAVALLIGLTSSLHCIGMCGAISGALSMSLPPRVRAQRGRLLLYNLLFSTGRIASYGIAGFLVGMAGTTLVQRLAPLAGVNLLRLLPALTVLLAGLYLGGWLPFLARVEQLGAPLWRRLEPLGRRLIPVRSPFQALAYGLVWGWLPCGLVYWALLIAATAGNAVKSSAFMVLFGLATVPSILATALLAGWIRQLRHRVNINRAAGLLLVVLGTIGVFYAVEIEQFLRPDQ